MSLLPSVADLRRRHRVGGMAVFDWAATAAASAAVTETTLAQPATQSGLQRVATHALVFAMFVGLGVFAHKIAKVDSAFMRQYLGLGVPE